MQNKNQEKEGYEESKRSENEASTGVEGTSSELQTVKDLCAEVTDEVYLNL